MRIFFGLGVVYVSFHFEKVGWYGSSATRKRLHLEECCFGHSNRVRVKFEFLDPYLFTQLHYLSILSLM